MSDSDEDNLPNPGPGGDDPSEDNEEAENEQQDGFDIVEPIMGGIRRLTQDTSAAWVGGKPMRDWSGLVQPNPDTIHPTQFRPSSIGSATKGQYYRVKGLNPKVGPNSEMLPVQRKVNHHMNTFGMISIAYLPDPTNPNEMVNIIDGYARFTIDSARAAEAAQHELYDQYDHANIRDAKQFLYNSLDAKYEAQLYENCDPEESFIIHYMHFIQIRGTIDVDTFDRIKDRIRARHVGQYSGQDIEAMCSDYLSDWQELQDAQMYEFNLTSKMLRAILKAGNEDFRYQLRGLKERVDSKVNLIAHMSYRDKVQEMSNDGLDVRTVLTKCKDAYRKQLVEKNWPASISSRDSRGINRSYGQVHHLQANELRRSNGMSGRDKSNDICRICNEKGHWAPDCPNKGNQMNTNSRNHGNRTRSANRQVRRNNRDNRYPRFPAPKEGESEIKRENGKIWYFCKKCRRWNPNHTTETHRSRQELNQSSSTPAANHIVANFDEHPCAYMASVYTTCPMHQQRQTGHFTRGGPGVDRSHIRGTISLNPLLMGISVAVLMAQGFMSTNGPILFSLMAFMAINSPGMIQIMRRSLRGSRRNPISELFRSERELKNRIGLLERRVTLLEAVRTQTPRTRSGQGTNSMGGPSRTNQRNSRTNQRRSAYVTLDSSYVSGPHAFHMATTRDERRRSAKNVLIDSGANCVITNDPTDFLESPEVLPKGTLVEGLGKGLAARYKGKIGWAFQADDASVRVLELEGYYVPTATTCIASTAKILDAYPDEQISITRNYLRMTGTKDIPSLTIPISPEVGLPIAETRPTVHVCIAPSPQAYKAAKPVLTMDPNLTLVSKTNHNISESEKELLRWHYRLGHVSIRRVQWMMRHGILATTERARRLHDQASKLARGILCAACQYAKQRRRPAPSTVKRAIPEETGLLTKDKLFPGQTVSVDHFHANPPGRLLNTYGKESSDKKYHNGCLFVDHGTAYTFVGLQVGTTSTETLACKEQFESLARSHGVTIQEYLTDRDKAFTSKEYTEHLRVFHQIARYANTGAHHSNGLAERHIGIVLSIARAMLHHMAIHWPEASSTELWPFAVLHAVYLVNRVPSPETGLSPYELFTRTTWPRIKFQDFHVWGCPVYVLDKSLADNHRISRWRPRAERYVYLGHSPKLSHSAPLLLDLHTGKVKPRFHVVFDDWFQTVPSSSHEQPDFDSPEWYQTFGLTISQYVRDGHADDDPSDDDDAGVPVPRELDQQVSTSADRIAQEHDALLRPADSLHPVEALPAPVAPSSDRPVPVSPTLVQEASPQSEVTSPVPLPQRETEPVEQPVHTSEGATEAESSRSSEGAIVPDQTPHASSPSSPPVPPSPRVVPDRVHPPSRPMTRSQTAPRRSERLRAAHRDSNIHVNLARVPEEPSLPSPVLTNPRTVMDPLTDFRDRQATALTAELAAYAASKSKSDPDTYTWDQAMSSPYAEQFREAADQELEALAQHGAWTEVPKSEATNKIVPTQWVFKIKRDPSGRIKKFKARLVCRGDLQDFEGETYASVASWSTVRSFLVMSEVLDRYTCTIDFSNAFIQSPLAEETKLWMHIPRGYTCTKGPGYCLRMLKSIYGTKDAPLLWFKYLTEKLRQLGLRQSKHDPCLWYDKDIMIVIYVDDVGISAKNKKEVDEFVQKLRDAGLTLTQEESFSEFLGIKFEKLPNGSIKMSQRGLIEKILETASMTNCNPNSVPAAQAALGTDKEGPDMRESWNYRSIVGMLLYLSTNTRPDIAFAVSQVARFSANPKQSHATAVKMILRYLKKTIDQGTIVTATDVLMLMLHVDADFAGLFKREDDYDENSVRSRTGYIVRLSGWPLVWRSQLQSHMSQSTLEAEYSALSHALKTFLPIKALVNEMIEHLDVKHVLKDTTVHATVFEDNQSAYYLATNQRITNRTKYFLVKWHWFWEQHNNGHFNIVKCPTDEQLADFLTKPLTKDKFEANRLKVLGW